jgi:hypothetical protein
MGKTCGRVLAGLVHRYQTCFKFRGSGTESTAAGILPGSSLPVREVRTNVTRALEIAWLT